MANRAFGFGSFGLDFPIWKKIWVPNSSFNCHIVARNKHISFKFYKRKLFARPQGCFDDILQKSSEAEISWMGIYSSYPPWFLGLRFVGALCCFCPNATTLHSELWPPFKIMENNYKHKYKYKCEENAKKIEFLHWQLWPSCLVNEVNVKRSWTQWNISATGKFELLHISRSSFYRLRTALIVL